MLDNHVEVANESRDDDEDNHEDDFEAENEDTLELADTKAAEYNRLVNLLSRNKSEIKGRKVKTEQFLKDASSPFLTDTDKSCLISK